MDEPIILTNEEAAHWLRLDSDYPDDPGSAVDALHRLVRQGHVRPIRGCGKTYKFSRLELERYVTCATESIDLTADCDTEGNHG